MDEQGLKLKFLRVCLGAAKSFTSNGAFVAWRESLFILLPEHYCGTENPPTHGKILLLRHFKDGFNSCCVLPLPTWTWLDACHMCRQVGDCGNPYEDSPKIPLNTIKCFQSIFCRKATNKDAFIELIVVGKSFLHHTFCNSGERSEYVVDTLARVRRNMTESRMLWTLRSILEVQAEGRTSLGPTCRKVKVCRQPSAIEDLGWVNLSVAIKHSITRKEC